MSDKLTRDEIERALNWAKRQQEAAYFIGAEPDIPATVLDTLVALALKGAEAMREGGRLAEIEARVQHLYDLRDEELRARHDAESEAGRIVRAVERGLKYWEERYSPTQGELEQHVMAVTRSIRAAIRRARER